MRIRTTLSLMGAALVTTTSLLGWQLWSSHQLRQDLSALQQTLSHTQAQTSAPAKANGNQLALNQSPSASIVPNAAPNSAVPHNPATPPQSPPQATPVNPPGTSGDPFDDFFSGFGNGADPFADFDQMRQQMEQQMQQLMGSMGAIGGPGGQSSQGGSPFDPFNNFNFGSAFSGAAQPGINLQEKPDAYVITIDLPKGSSDVEVNAAVENGQLNIEGKLTVKHEDQQQGHSLSSLQTQQFSRRLPLPADADPLGIHNETQGDQMIVTVPKQTG
jgi:HSP20 family molecular chaperone IbpA